MHRNSKLILSIILAGILYIIYLYIDEAKNRDILIKCSEEVLKSSIIKEYNDYYGSHVKIEYIKGNTEDTVTVLSAGRDKKFSTNDDILITKKMSIKAE